MHSSELQQACTALIRQQRLPDDFYRLIEKIYLPLSELILQRKQSAPLLVSINGAQGSGKTTMVSFLKLILESALNASVAVLSLDDFYHTRQKRLSLSQKVHPLLLTRGVPGTHDIELLSQVLQQLLDNRACRIPIFDKALDERVDESLWLLQEKPVEIILFEGWCNNSPAQPPHDLLEPINALEREEDKDVIWRRYVNEQLIDYHQRIFGRVDLCIMLKAPGFDSVYRWRRLQEQKLKASGGEGRHTMGDVELKRFIQHFERITRHTLKELPKTADIILPLAEDHSITAVIKKPKSLLMGCSSNQKGV